MLKYKGRIYVESIKRLNYQNAFPSMDPRKLKPKPKRWQVNLYAARDLFGSGDRNTDIPKGRIVDRIQNIPTLEKAIELAEHSASPGSHLMAGIFPQ